MSKATAPTQDLQQGPAKSSGLSTDRLMQICIGIATLFFFNLAYTKYHYFNGEMNDLTVFAYSFEHSFHGEFLPVYFGPGSLLGCHVNWVILFWMPVFAVCRSFYSLLFYQSLMLTVAAWPFYLLAKHVLKNARAAFVMGIAFLVFPTIAGQHVNQIHDDQFALPFVMAAFYFFVRRDYRWFVVNMVLACMGKESMTLTMGSFGVYALFERRDWKWVVTPIVFSVCYLAFAIYLLRHVFAGMGAPVWEAAYHLGVYGKTYPEILTTFVTRPGFVLQTVFSHERLDYLFKLSMPVLFVLPLCSLAFIVSLPNLMLNLIVPNMAFTVIPWHYNIILGATLLVAAVFGIEKIVRFLKIEKHNAAVVIAVLMVGLALSEEHYWYNSLEYQPQANDAALQQALTAVPIDASVLCPSPMLAHLANRKKINTAYSILVVNKDPQKILDYDYIILNANWRAYEAIGQAQLVKLINDNPDLGKRYQTVMQENNVFVLHLLK